MGEIKKSLDLSDHPFSKRSWAALSSPSFAIFWGGEFNATVATIRETPGWKTQAVWSVKCQVIYSWEVFQDRGCTRSSWIDFFLVSLLDSTRVGIHQFQHVLPYYPLQVKTKGDWVHFCGKKQVAVIRARGREMAAMLRIQSGPLGVAQSSPPNLQGACDEGW